MDFNMERWYAAVGQRFSMRSYAGSPSEEELEHLGQMAEMLSVRGVRIVLGKGDVFSSQFLGMGKVRGTDCFAAFLVRDAQPAAAGYLGEAFVLECTAMGLGTCWLGVFRRNAVEKIIVPGGGEKVLAIAAVGQRGEPATTRPRRSLRQITGLTQEELTALPEWQQRALECARMAPSAVNGQPWAFHVRDERITIRMTSTNFGYGALDNGIAMLHLELGAAHAGVAGRFETRPNGATFIPAAYGR